MREEKTSWNRSIGATHPEELVELAGRICYMSFGKSQSPKTTAKFIRDLIDKGHESVLEHVNWTFLITGISRALSHQLVRHRVGFSFSQLSQQYKIQTNVEFIEPTLFKNLPSVEAVWQRVVQMAKEAYIEILQSLKDYESETGGELENKEIKRAIQSAARSVLPNATETKLLMTANARALRHFLKVRGSIPGDDEMRRLCAEILKDLLVEAPSLFFDFHVNVLPDGSPIIIHTAD
jgi:thymidylate synthase (FAD)